MLDERVDVFRADREVLGMTRGAPVAGCATKRRDLGAAGKGPGQGVLTPAATDQEDFQGSPQAEAAFFVLEDLPPSDFSLFGEEAEPDVPEPELP